MASLYRFDSYPPVDNIEFIDIENQGAAHGASEGTLIDTPWTFSAAPITGFHEASVACALRSGAARFTCNGEMLHLVPEQPVQQQPRSLFVRCDNDLSSVAAAPVNAQQTASLRSPYLSASRATTTPFGEVPGQLPANGSEAERLDHPATLDESFFLEDYRVKNLNCCDGQVLKGADSNPADLIFAELPASPARCAPEASLRPLPAAQERPVQLDFAEQPQLRRQSVPSLPEPSPMPILERASHPVPDNQAAAGRPPAAQEAEASSSYSHPHLTACGGPSSSCLLHAHQPQPQPLVSAPGRSALPAPSSQSSLVPDPAEAEADSECESDVVRHRSSRRGSLEVSSAVRPRDDGGVAGGAGLPRRLPGGEAGSAAATAQEQQQRGQKRRAAAVAAARVVKAVREREEEDDTDEDYYGEEEQEGLAAGGVNRGAKRAKKAAGPRQPGSKARSDISCLNCRATSTPQWRCGPEGPRTLCNACGVRYKKGKPLAYLELKKKQNQQAAAHA